MTAHILFDLDGTLVDSAPTCAAILNDMLVDRGVSGATLGIEQVRGLISIGGEAMIRRCLGPVSTDATSDLVEFRERYRSTPTPPTSLYPHVRDVLLDLSSSGLTLSVCSNKPQFLCEKVLRDLDLAGFFQTILGTRPGVRGKPSPDLLAAVVAAGGHAPDRCCLVGDSEADHAAAREFGMPFILVGHGYADPQYSFTDCMECADFLEVHDSIDSLFGLESSRELKRIRRG